MHKPSDHPQNTQNKAVENSYSKMYILFDYRLQRVRLIF